ncbi:MAG: DUF1292 domain-containing protein [Epulopiscium sp.]|nr:DUF1292 domain-containing protein [Candidatus Epulonipiscium sp.]
MKDSVVFYNEDTGEEIYFEIIDSFDLDGQRYILVADDNDDATILKEVEMGEEITFEFIEDDAEFQKISLLFLEVDSDYKLEF